MEIHPPQAARGHPLSAGPRLVFVNGRMRPSFWVDGDLPEGVRIECLKDTLSNGADWAQEYLGRISNGDDQPLLALNTAMMDSGFVLRVEDGVEVPQPIEVIFIGGLTDGPVAYFPRNLIVLGRGARATVVKHHVGLGVGAYFANSVTEIEIGEGARLNHYTVQAESLDATHLSTVHARVAKDGTYESFYLSIGGRLSRNEVSVRLEVDGEIINGLGADPDTIFASARAYVNALNKMLVADEKISPEEMFA